MIIIIAIVILIYLLKVTPETQAAELLYQLNHQLKIDLVENEKHKNPGNLAVGLYFALMASLDLIVQLWC